MKSMQQTVGECPQCGDELYVFRTYSYKRFAKCINPDCQYSYPLPSKGSIEETGVCCPQSAVQILAIIPNIRLTRGRYQAQENQTYFWANRPCFTCPSRNQCANWKEVKEDY